jgi:peptidoglycan/xylan/chitin deacetylase (PgdA/CDA1 family)
MERGADRLSRWPGGARAAVSVTFDNLGEAAEIELGLRDPRAARGGHYSVTTALPIVLSELAEAGLSATFFIEGVNAEIYPDALRGIAAAGHELAYHAWGHEDWSTLTAAAEVENLDRGLAALGALGVEVLGMRPPGGLLTERTLTLLHSRGLRYCSPAGSALGIDRVAVLPFMWESVDAFHILPVFASLRERRTGSADAGGPPAVRAALMGSVEDALATGGHAMLVLHTWLVEFVRDDLRGVLAKVREHARAGELWVAPCRQVAALIAEEHPRGEGVPPAPATPVLDYTTWNTRPNATPT